jgi:2-oxo-4-hydroxy-4-carboxy-5-ureidoimidazoline decarboxylase
MSLNGWNSMPEAEVVAALSACCSSPRWARQVAAARPFASVEDVVELATAVLAGLDETEVDAALAGHPRIGERSDHPSSRREQAAVAVADPDVLAGLAAGNEEYERRFGHVYLVCADGRAAAELLAVLRARLGNEPAAERRVVRGELARINAIRLRRMLATGQEES